MVVEFELARCCSVGDDAPAKGADERLRRMVATHYELVWRSLRRFGIPAEDVDDGAQQVFIVASRRLGDIADGKERAFLLQTALRIASESRRARSRRREEGDESLFEKPHPAPSPEELVDQHRARKLLDELLATLPLELRTVLVLFEMEQMSRAEIAEVLGLAPGTVASRLSRARESFDLQLERYFGSRPKAGTHE